MSVRWALPLVVVSALLIPTAAPASTASTAGAAGAAGGTGSRACPAPGFARVTHGSGNVQVFAVQVAQQPATASSIAAIDRQVGCLFATEVAPYRRPGVPGLVVFDEVGTLSFALQGGRGAAARLLAASPAAGLPGQVTNEPLGALGEGLGLLAAGYAPQIAFYAARFPRADAGELVGDAGRLAGGSVTVPADRVFLALTDTYVAAIWSSFRADARRYGVEVVVGAVLPVLDGERACAAAGYRGWPACPGWRLTTEPADVAAIGGPAVPGAPTGARQVAVADTATVENVALVFGPGGQLVAVQPKVNLTPLEAELGWQAAPPSTIRTVPMLRPGGRAVPGVRLGIATSLDAFEHAGGRHPCRRPTAYVACLDHLGATLLVQPDFNDGVPHCPSWSTFGARCGAAQWQPLAWMMSSWYDVEARTAGGAPLYPSLRAAVNAFMVGNLYDLTGDGQSAIVVRGGGGLGAYAGDRRAAVYRQAGPATPYPDPAGTSPLASPAAPVSLAQLDGLQPGFVAMAPWVLPPSATVVRAAAGIPAGSPRALQSCEEGLVPASGVTSGPCRQDAYRSGVLVATVRV